MLTNKWHEEHCSIYKSEGGCNVPEVGELVLAERALYFDGYFYTKLTREQAEKKVQALVTDVVLNWDPMDPIESMYREAAKHIGVKPKELRVAVNKSSNGGVFGGNALCDFFSWNPFSDAPIDREYQRWCMKKFEGKSDKEINQMYEDIDLGKSLREKINAEIGKREPGSYRWAMCCSPRRMDNGELKFWVNTGRRTQIDGWRTQVELERFINATDEKLEDKATY